MTKKEEILSKKWKRYMKKRWKGRTIVSGVELSQWRQEFLKKEDVKV